MAGDTGREAERRLTSIREAREAACGDWHELTSLWSIQKDIDWLLRVVEQVRLTDQWADVVVAAQGARDGG